MIRADDPMMLVEKLLGLMRDADGVGDLSELRAPIVGRCHVRAHSEEVPDWRGAVDQRPLPRPSLGPCSILQDLHPVAELGKGFLIATQVYGDKQHKSDARGVGRRPR